MRRVVFLPLFGYLAFVPTVTPAPAQPVVVVASGFSQISVNPPQTQTTYGLALANHSSRPAVNVVINVTLRDAHGLFPIPPRAAYARASVDPCDLFTRCLALH
jgi:hypothetical protein